MVNLGKIELTKKGQSINLEKKAQLGPITVNLNWNQQTKPSGGFLKSLFGNNSSGIDLDLGCLFELTTGEKGAIQALGNSFGSLQHPPYIELDGDDRTGTVSGGENLRINGEKVANIKRILVYAFIYEGVSNWSEADGVVTISYPGGQDIVVRLDEYRNGSGMCAIALIENVQNETFNVKRLVDYFSGHSKMDAAYNWGLRWQAGSK